MKPNQRNKIFTSFKESLANDNQLNKKLKTYQVKPNQSLNFKLPRTLYDSGWIDPGVSSGSIISGNSSVYFTYTASSSLLNQSLPYYLNYSLSQILNVPESWLPFIECSLLVKTAPTSKVEGVFNYNRWDFADDYWEIDGDGTKIYHGYSPSDYLLSETDRIAGIFNSSLASKWYYGTLQYINGGDSYKLSNGYIDEVTTYYDVEELAGHPGVYSYKKFICPAIDGISSSAVTGTGTYLVHTAADDGMGGYTESNVTVKNATMTAPLFEDSIIVKASGLLYKNDVYQQTYSVSSPLSIYFDGTFGGTATLSSFSYNWTTNQYWKLFYSSYRAKQFDFNTGLRLLYNLPTISDYQSGTLPYSNITVKENPSGYPEIEEESSENYRQGAGRKLWTKVNDNAYVYRIAGVICLSSQAKNESSDIASFVEETYSPSGSTYTRVAENREDKSVPIYFPVDEGSQFRWILSFINPLDMSNQGFIEAK